MEGIPKSKISSSSGRTDPSIVTDVQVTSSFKPVTEALPPVPGSTNTASIKLYVTISSVPNATPVYDLVTFSATPSTVPEKITSTVFVSVQ